MDKLQCECGGICTRTIDIPIDVYPDWDEPIGSTIYVNRLCPWVYTRLDKWKLMATVGNTDIYQPRRYPIEEMLDA